MIKDDYVSFELAKLLKNKGFNEPCYACYIDDGISHYDYCSTNFELVDDVVSAPTLQIVMKWFRKVHKNFIESKMSKNTFLWGFKRKYSRSSCKHF